MEKLYDLHFLLSVNLANSKTYQSQTSTIDTSRLAIDGKTETCSIAEQDSLTEHPWWRLELDRLYRITDLTINFESDSSGLLIFPYTCLQYATLPCKME